MASSPESVSSGSDSMSDSPPPWDPPSVLRSSSSIVHLSYELETLPPKPTEGDWTRFVCISDTHNHACEVPPGEVVLHCGDLTGTGTLRGFETTMNWLYTLPHPIKM